MESKNGMKRLGKMIEREDGRGRKWVYVQFQIRTKSWKLV